MARSSRAVQEMGKWTWSRWGWRARAAATGAAALAMAVGLAPVARAGGDAGIGPMGPAPAVSSGPPAPVNQPNLVCDGSAAAHVAGLGGTARVQGPDGAVRGLGCGDDVSACDTIVTGPGSEVSLTQGDLFAQLGPDSRLQVGGGSAGPSFFLHDGSVRVIDQRTGQVAPYQVATPQATARATGGDAEVQVLAQRAAASTRVCSQDTPVTVTSGKRQTLVAPGSCSEAEARSLRSEPATSAAMALAGPMQCSFAATDLASRFRPGDVAAPPMAFVGFPQVAPANLVQRQPCDVPGSVCGFPFRTSGVGGQTIQEQTPGTNPGAIGAPGFGGTP